MEPHRVKKSVSSGMKYFLNEKIPALTSQYTFLTKPLLRKKAIDLWKRMSEAEKSQYSRQQIPKTGKCVERRKININSLAVTTTSKEQLSPAQKRKNKIHKHMKSENSAHIYSGKDDPNMCDHSSIDDNKDYGVDINGNVDSGNDDDDENHDVKCDSTHQAVKSTDNSNVEVCVNKKSLCIATSYATDSQEVVSFDSDVDPYEITDSIWGGGPKLRLRTPTKTYVGSRLSQIAVPDVIDDGLSGDQRSILRSLSETKKAKRNRVSFDMEQHRSDEGGPPNKQSLNCDSDFTLLSKNNQSSHMHFDMTGIHGDDSDEEREVRLAVLHGNQIVIPDLEQSGSQLTLMKDILKGKAGLHNDNWEAVLKTGEKLSVSGVGTKVVEAGRGVEVMVGSAGKAETVGEITASVDEFGFEINVRAGYLHVRNTNVLNGNDATCSENENMNSKAGRGERRDVASDIGTNVLHFNVVCDVPEFTNATENATPNVDTSGARISGTVASLANIIKTAFPGIESEIMTPLMSELIKCSKYVEVVKKPVKSKMMAIQCSDSPCLPSSSLQVSDFDFTSDAAQRVAARKRLHRDLGNEAEVKQESESDFRRVASLSTTLQEDVGKKLVRRVCGVRRQFDQHAVQAVAAGQTVVHFDDTDNGFLFDIFPSPSLEPQHQESEELEDSAGMKWIDSI